MPAHASFPDRARSPGLLFATVCLVSACKSDEKPAAAPPTAPATTPAPAAAPRAADDAAALAAKAKVRIAIDRLGVGLEVPEGTTITPPRDAEEASRRANLRQGAFMVNVSAVDKFSTPSFAEAKVVHKSDTLVAWFRAEETPTGWITFKEVVSALHESNRFEVAVRTTVSGRKWDCSVSAPSKAFAELALAACQTLTANTPSAPRPTEANAKPTKPASSAKSTTPAKPAARPAPRAQAQVHGALTKDVIGRIVRGHSSRLRSCYERQLVNNPTLAVTVTTAFVIGGNGQVSMASTAGGDAQLATCIAGVFRTMQFPSPADGRSVRASYPLRFQPDAS